MKPFVGYKKELLSVPQLLEFIRKFISEPSYYFLRWTHEVSGIVEKPPKNDDFPMIEGQMFNHECELRWKYKRQNTCSGSHFGAIQSSPHPAFADANAPLSLVRRGVGGEVEKCTLCKRELLYEVLLLTIADNHDDFIPVKQTSNKEKKEPWRIEPNNPPYAYPAYGYRPDETRFPKKLIFPKNLDTRQEEKNNKPKLAQRYFIDNQTSTVQFIALTVEVAQP